MTVAALRRSTEPALRYGAVDWKIVSATTQGAKGKHRAAVALVRRFLEQLKRGIRRARSAPPVHHHFGKGNLSVQYTGVRGPRKPHACLTRVGWHTASLQQQTPIHI